MRSLSALQIAAGLAVLAAAPAPAFEPAGEVRFRTRSGAHSGAAFDGERVVGPGVDLGRVPDGGGWTGTLEGGHTQLWPTPDGFAGDAVIADLPSARIAIHLIRAKRGFEIRGLFLGRMTHLTLDERSISGRVGNCSIDLARRGHGLFEGDVGCTHRAMAFPAVTKGTVRLLGNAAHPDPPMPQLAIALLASLPR